MATDTKYVGSIFKWEKEQMKKYRQQFQYAVTMLLILVGAFVVNLWIEYIFQTKTQISMIFVLGVFLISWRTPGYFWGVTASMISVLAVNYAFTYPYYAFDLMSPECVSSAVVMLIVATMTGTLTTKIKKQEKMKAEAETERMRGNLLRAVSHDLRTPLTSIYGGCSAIMENYDSLKKEQHLKLLGEMQEDAIGLINMVENLLSVTRIDGARVQVTKVPTVLEELIDNVLVKFHKHCPKQEVLVEIPDEFVSIPMDSMLITQVLINILENAVDHAEGMTELKLTVSVEGEMAKFCVSDNGCGITRDKMDKLFTGYLNWENTPADGSRNNMGIGLSVCSAIVKAHGSEIYAENNESGGATFYFSLRMEKEDE